MKYKIEAIKVLISSSSHSLLLSHSLTHSLTITQSLTHSLTISYLLTYSLTRLPQFVRCSVKMPVRKRLICMCTIELQKNLVLLIKYLMISPRQDLVQVSLTITHSLTHYYSLIRTPSLPPSFTPSFTHSLTHYSSLLSANSGDDKVSVRPQVPVGHQSNQGRFLLGKNL